MQVKITHRHGQPLASDVQEYIRDHAEKLMHLFNRITFVEVTVDHEKDLHRVEFKVDAEHKHDFVATEKNENLHAAVDSAAEKLSVQLRRYKEKVQEHRREGSHRDRLENQAPE